MGDHPRLMPVQSQTRQAPYSVEAEQTVLGAMMLDNRVIATVRGKLVAESFFRADHQVIFAAICAMADDRKPVDFVTLSAHAKQAGTLDEMGGIAYLSSLWENTIPTNADAYADIVMERALLRSLIAAGGDIAELGYRPEGKDVDEVMDEARARLSRIETVRSTEGEFTLMGDMAAAWHDDYHSRKAAVKAPGIQTGFKNLDAVIIGMEPGDLVLAGGATGMGKTILGLSIAEHVASYEGPAAGVSLEMPKKQWMTRLVASRGRIPLSRLRDPRQTDFDFDEEVTRALAQVNRLPFYVSDTAGQSIHQIRARTLRLQERLKGGLKLLLVDYIQLVAGDRRQSDSRAIELDSVSRGLKRLAKECGCVVMALAQVNDDANKRDNKRPRLSDFRESKGLTQDADIVILLYRDEYHDRKSPHAGIVEVDVVKQRNGELKVAELQWLGGYCAMTDYFGPSASERIAAARAQDPEKPSGRGGMKAPKSLLPVGLQS